MKALKIIAIVIGALIAIPIIVAIGMAAFSDSSAEEVHIEGIPDHIHDAAEDVYTTAQHYDSINDLVKAKERLKYITIKYHTSPYADSAVTYLEALQPRITADSLQRIKQSKADRIKYAAMFTVKKDDFNGTSFYRHKKSPTYSDNTALIVYLGKSGNFVYPRFKIQYGSDDWLFMKEWMLKADDETYLISSNSYDVKRDNSGGRVWEWYDIEPSTAQLAFLKKMAVAKVAKVRYSGTDYYHDYTLTANNRKSLKETIDAYEAFLIDPQLAP